MKERFSMKFSIAQMAPTYLFTISHINMMIKITLYLKTVHSSSHMFHKRVMIFVFKSEINMIQVIIPIFQGYLLIIISFKQTLNYLELKITSV